MNDDLVRLEYKLDLLLQALMDKGLMVPDLPRIEGIEGDSCPVCQCPIKVVPDYAREAVRYCCGCITPNKVVSGISGLLTTDEEKNNGSSRTTESSEVFQPEKDRSSDS